VSKYQYSEKKNNTLTLIFYWSLEVFNVKWRWI